MFTTFTNPTLHSPVDNLWSLDFELPDTLEASQPPEARGLERDQVRLMVSTRSDDRVVHTEFRQIGSYLTAGDVLVINTSGTMNAALSARRADGTLFTLHLSTHLPADLWIVEVRMPSDNATQPFYEAIAGEILRLPGNGAATLLTPYLPAHRGSEGDSKVRLWLATLRLPCRLHR